MTTTSLHDCNALCGEGRHATLNYSTRPHDRGALDGIEWWGLRVSCLSRKMRAVEYRPAEAPVMRRNELPEDYSAPGRDVPPDTELWPWLLMFELMPGHPGYSRQPA